MSLRTRIAATAAIAVAVAVALVGVVVFTSTQRQLARSTDADLVRVATSVAALPAEDVLAAVAGDAADRGPPGRRSPLLDRLRGARDEAVVQRLLGPLGGGVVQLVRPDGTLVGNTDLVLPVEPVSGLRDGLDGTPSEPVLTDAVVDGRDVRVATVGAGRLGVLQVGVPVDDRSAALDALRRQLGLAGLLGVALAAALGLVVADRAVRPVRRLTDTAEDVRRTGDLGTRIEVHGDDELAALAASFNAMLGSLDEARAAQQQLVADASHELRTPLTSLRTNLEVLRMGEQRLAPEERDALVADVLGQLGEMGRLVDGLVELARGERPAAAPTSVVLGEVVAEVVERAAVFSPEVDVQVERDDSVVVAEEDRLRRAVSNLVDNAVKHGRGAMVDVRVADGVLTVRDHGPGIPPEALPHVLGRFYRAPGARALPGSGLGLSIVEQVARSHGGTVEVANHPDGGAVVTLTLPTGGRDGG